ncbi:hypothetical protein [Rhizobium rhizogenes]|uniref:hypothetical protein n=1 Tax=Rhizobium rhizogenes TaxID=359 RepID=UPI001574AEE3|nr:hypothetical protein [Rhizobium rhizogenes]NTG05519.1 hypothetical protein [Rhizobium rhizogenes]NTG12119.1 hypothetical protein [Rhizobium rhizogenes]
MEIVRIVEIAVAQNEPPIDLIRETYRASECVAIALVLNGVSPQTVNAVLDPIVATMSLAIPGVIYLDIRQQEQLREAIISASQIYVATQQFLDFLLAYRSSAKVIPLPGSDLKDLEPVLPRETWFDREHANGHFERAMVLSGTDGAGYLVTSSRAGTFCWVANESSRVGKRQSWI